MRMDKKTTMDEKGRITIPSDIRKTIGKKHFKVELQDRDTIILKVINTQNDFIEKIKEIKLKGDPERKDTDFSTIKDHYYGKSVEID
jgi:bifunctional DNA-binding transcriptional regulator/antitoxin component of YhaV-PrlF toxin-antitoxin module